MKTKNFAIPLQAIAVIIMIEFFTLLGGQFNATGSQNNCNFNSLGINYSTVFSSGFIVFFLVTVWWWLQDRGKTIPETSPESQYLTPENLICDYQFQEHNQVEIWESLSKKAGQALQESEARFRNAFDYAAIGMGLIAIDGRWLKVNQSLCEITGYSESELLQTKYQNITHTDDLITDFDYVNQLLKGEIRYYQIEKRYIHKQRHIVWVLLSKSLVRNCQNEPLYFIAQIQDITDRQATQAALKESETRFQAFMNNSPFLAWITTENGQVVYSNKNLAQWFAKELEQVIGKNIAELHPKPLAKAHLENIRQVINTGKVLQTNELSYRSDGSLAEFLVYKFPLTENREKSLVGGVAVDITEEKKAVKAAKLQYEQERLLDIIVQHIRQSLNLKEILQTTVTEIQKFLDCDRVVISRISLQNYNAEVIVESRSPHCQSLLGWKISNNLYQQPTDYKIAKGHSNQVINQNNQNLLEPFDVQAQLTIPIWQNKHIWGWLIAHSCQTKRQWKAKETSLLQRLKNQLEVAIYQSELHHQLQQLNANLERQVQARTLEFQQALTFEATLKRITDKVRDSFDERQILQQAVEELAKALEVNYCETNIYNLDKTISIIRYQSINNSSSLYEIKGINPREELIIYQQLLSGQHFAFCNLRPSGESENYAIFACPIVDDQGVLGDIRLFKPELSSFSGLEIRLVQQVANQCAIALRQSHLYQAAQKQVAELEKLNQLKDDFLSTISHELRTPVSNIKMISQILAIILAKPENICNQSQEINGYLQIIKDESQREMDLINDLLILTQISADTEPLVLNTIHLQVLIPHIIEIFTETIYQQQQQLQINIPDNLPALTTDVNFLERIFTELLNNACKYTPSGETIIVTAKTLKDKLQISVSNTGIEIPLVEKERIFDKFYRIPSNDPWKQGGTGLGLALVKKLMEHLGGTIELGTNDGEVKTTFLLSFPLVSRLPKNTHFSEFIAS